MVASGKWQVACSVRRLVIISSCLERFHHCMCEGKEEEEEELSILLILVNWGLPMGDISHFFTDFHPFLRCFVFVPAIKLLQIASVLQPPVLEPLILTPLRVSRLLDFQLRWPLLLVPWYLHRFWRQFPLWGLPLFLPLKPFDSEFRDLNRVCFFL